MKLKCFFFRQHRVSSRNSSKDRIFDRGDQKKGTKMGANASQRIMLMDGSIRSQQQRVTPLDDLTVIGRRSREDSSSESGSDGEKEDLSISFGYQCKQQAPGTNEETFNVSNRSTSESSLDETPAMKLIPRKSSSFSCLSGAALSANATLANTALGNGLIGEEILPGLDSPRTFRKLVSSSSATKLEFAKHLPIFENTTSPSATELPTIPHFSPTGHSSSAPHRMESASFLNANDVQTAGGAAGEDRVQAVCSEENGWLFCGIYDGFNGRDAADYLAGTFYETVGLHLKLLEWHVQREHESGGRLPGTPEEDVSMRHQTSDGEELRATVDEIFQQGVMQGLGRAFAQTENDFLEMVEQEMDERPELVMVGSCVLAVLLHGQNLYTLNVGDSRAVLATTHPPENSIASERVDGTNFWAVQLTESHVVENDAESKRVLEEHPDDPGAISGGRLKGKLKVTRAFGAGYLKQAILNNALMGILRIKNLFSPPYLDVSPCVSAHSVSEEDSFVVLGSDGLFDFFTNEEVVNLVHTFVLENPAGDPAKYMLEQLLLRAAENAGMSVEQLKGIPIGRRRKYHDDVTIIVISLGALFPTSKASTELVVG